MKQAAQLVLTERCRRILLMTYTYGGCTAEHIRRREFPSPGARSACYAWIARLVKAEYLTSVRLPCQYTFGSGKAFLTPGPKARPILAEALGLSRTELGRLRIDSPLFISHHLQLCDLRLSLEIACERSPLFTLQEWIGDHELNQTPIRVVDPDTKKPVSFVADASFTLALSDGSEQTFLLELDLSTQSPKRMREKFRCYLVRAKKDRSPILFVTLDQARSDTLVRYAQEEAAKLKMDPTIFWLSTKSRVSSDTILDEPIWAITGGPSSIALSSVAGVSPKPPILQVQPVFAGGFAR